MKQKVSQYIKSEFAPGSRPHRNTVIAAIKRGELQGEYSLGQWWILIDQSPPPASTGNKLADRVLDRQH